jgi:diguanylate cyclase (GGDEF)-like protein/PAS domain S-box-containing protein
MSQKLTRVLIIEDNEDDIWLVNEFLSQLVPRKYELHSSFKLSDALNRLENEVYDLILLDLNLPESKGEETLLDSRITDLDYPIIVLTGLNDEALALKAVQAGAQDYLVKGEFDDKVLARSIDYAIERHQLKKQILEASYTDPLTGLYNRKGFNALAEQQRKLAQRNQSEFLFFFIDVDDLKNINDSFGHQKGDQALEYTAQILRNTFRDSDILGRAGGDEFIVLMVDTNIDDSDVILRRFESERTKIFSTVEDYELTFSIGQSAWSFNEQKTLDELLGEADAAMYTHKRAKQNSIVSKPKVVHQDVTEKPGDNPVILLVEDSPDDSQLIKSFIGEIASHYQVQHVERLSEALSFIKNNPVTLVLLDLTLPDSQGLDSVESLIYANPEIPLIVMTEQDVQDGAINALQMGAQDFLSKGNFDADLLSRSIKYAIERQRLIVESSRFARELKISEEHLNSFFEDFSIGMYRTTPQGEILYANQALVRMMGYESFEQLAERNLEEIGFIDQAQRKQFIRQIEATGHIDGFEARWKKADGSLIYIRENAKAIYGDNGEILYYEGSAENISVQKEAQNQLIIQSAALDAAANAIVITDRAGDILWVNPAFEDLTGYEMSEVIGKQPSILKSGAHEEQFYQRFWETINNGLVWQGEMINRRKDGSNYPEQQTVAPVLDSDGEISHFIAIKEDITARKATDEVTQRHLNELKVLSSVAAAGVEETDEDALIERVTEIIGESLFSDQFGVMLLDERKHSFLVHPSYRGLPDDFQQYEIDISDGVVGTVATTGQARREPDVSVVPEFIYASPDIRSGLCVPLFMRGRVMGVINTESKRKNYFSEADERLLTTVAGQLATAIERIRQQTAENEQRVRAEALSSTALALNSSLSFDQILDHVLNDIARIIPHEAAYIFLNEGGKARVTRYLNNDQNAYSSHIEGHQFHIAETNNLKTMLETGEPLKIPDVHKYPGWINLSGGEWIRSHLGVAIQKDNHAFGFLTIYHSKPDYFSDSDGRTLQALANQLATAMDNARLYQRQQYQLTFLESLHQIDLAITGSLNLQVTLDVIVHQITSQLSVDATSILLLDPFTLSLDPVAVSGFSSDDMKSKMLRMGEGLGGLVAKEGNVIHHTNLVFDTNPNYPRSDIFIKEGFSSYYGIPITAKGQMKGVLEIYHREPFEPDYEWENFIVTVATQAAIAIDNASMFENLEKTNLELSLAYDTTLEGWAKALELRDRETVGHARRVVEVTMKLGRKLGVSGLDLVHLRRGALLHDVGKMGVPDSILQKPGPLTQEEWEIMRQHPVYAFEWLRSINYLSPALDIPHYHHERWDGSGYPQGLVGEQIPLFARIFAVVDVWDALLSDRPYRNAWSPEKVIAYIRRGAGTLFDPRVVEAFIEIIQQLEISHASSPDNSLGDSESVA